MLAILVFALLVGLPAVGFALLSSEVLEGETGSFDVRILEGARSLRQAHPQLAESMRDVTALGSVTVLTAITLIVAGYMYLLSNRMMAAMVAVSALLGTTTVTLLKAAFDRVRPDPDFAHMLVEGPAYPSSHASMSAVIYLTIAALVATTREARSERIYLIATAAVLALLVGASRVILGVHWATDVIAGWIFGAAWSMAWVMLHEGRRRRVNPPVARG